MSQERLAAKAGVSRSTIQNIESGRAGRAYRLRDVADALGVDIETLIGHTREPPDPPDDDDFMDADEEELYQRIRKLPPLQILKLLELIRTMTDDEPAPQRR